MRKRWRFARTGRVHWPSAAIAVVGTGLLFASAFIAMTRVSSFRFNTSRTATEPPRFVALIPPEPAPKLPPSSTLHRPAPTPRSERPIVRETPPEPDAPRDTATAPRTSAARAATPAAPVPSWLTTRPPLRDIPLFPNAAPRGAPSLTTGPTGIIGRPAELTAAQRDSMAQAEILAIARAARERTLTADEKERLRQQQEPGLPALGRAARLPGAVVSVPTMGGNYAYGVAGFGIAIGRQRDRKRDDAVDSANRAALARLQDRARLQQDAVRAAALHADSSRRDSASKHLHADSLRRDSIARGLRRPGS